MFLHENEKRRRRRRKCLEDEGKEERQLAAVLRKRKILWRPRLEGKEGMRSNDGQRWNERINCI